MCQRKQILVALSFTCIKAPFIGQRSQDRLHDKHRHGPRHVLFADPNAEPELKTGLNLFRTPSF
jgi:hypothetical protein